MMKKKWIMIGFLAAVMLQTSMTAFAAPKQMSDGTIFDAVYYADSNPDVKAVFGTNEQNLYTHYKLFGKNEGRLPVAPTAYPTPATQQSVASIMENGFDPVYYANNNKDVVAVLGNDPQKLYLHYIDSKNVHVDFSGDAVDKNRPANAEDTGLIPVPERFHMFTTTGPPL